MALKSSVTILAIYIAALNIGQCEIRNGYEPEVNGARESLKALIALLNEDTEIPLGKKYTMKTRINKLAEFINYYELTKELLSQFQLVAPKLYNEIEETRDYSGLPVTIFVRFVPEEEMKNGMPGTTNVDCVDGDRSTYESEYGSHSVSIRIGLTTRSLMLLAHELGHAKYQIANLATYLEYYTTHYMGPNFNSKYIGHNSDDPSGRMANEYQMRFQEKYLEYLKFSKSSLLKMESPLALMQTIRKRRKSESL
jgi:hypothetical protein